MKQRTFYVINLDRSRILMITAVLVGFVLVAFATGFRYGRSDGPRRVAADRSLNRPSADPLRTGNSDRPDPTTANDPSRTSPTGGELGRSPRELSGSEPRSQTSPTSDPMHGLVDDSLRSAGNRHVSRESRDPGSSGLRSDRRRQTENRRERTEKHSSRLRRENRRAENRRTRTTSHRTRSKRTPTKREEKRERASNRRAPRTAMRNVGLERSVARQLRKERIPQTKNVPAGKKDVPSKEKSTSSGRYALQLGTYRFEGGAQRLVALLQKQGFPARLVHSGKMHKVMVGSTSDKAELQRLRAGLRKRRYAPITVRVRAAR